MASKAKKPKVDLSQATNPEVRKQADVEAAEIRAARQKLQNEFFNTRLARSAAIADKMDKNINKGNDDVSGTTNDESDDRESQTDEYGSIGTDDGGSEQDSTGGQSATGSTTSGDGSSETRNGRGSGKNTNRSDAQADATDNGSVLVTLFVNGKEVTKTKDEWLAQAARSEETGDMYEEAAATLARSRKPLEVDLKALSKTIREGSDDESAAALGDLVKAAEESARARAVEANNNERARIEFNRILDENKDLATNPTYYKLAQANEQKLQNKKYSADPVADFAGRFREAWKLTRAEIKSLNTQIKGEDEISKLNKRKQNAPNLKTSTSTSESQLQSSTQDQRTNRTDAIAAMKRGRDAVRNQ